MKKPLYFLLLLPAFLAGCGPSTPVAFRPNTVERIKFERVNLKEGEQVDSRYQRQIDHLLDGLFGTPDEPRFPRFVDESGEVAPSVVSIDRLRMAAGPVSSDREDQHVGLYRKHCAHCHGITGDGAGPTAGMLNPYPRDFRLGKFKFKVTPLRTPPTDGDLRRTLRTGIPGAGMPSFSTLPDDQIDALVDYVKYLAIRGEYEKRLWSEVAGRDGADLVPDATTLAEDGLIQEDSLDDGLFELLVEALKEETLARWENPGRRATPVPAPPAALDPHDPGQSELVEAGRKLFYTKANCVQCHGDTGLGDGQTENFDDWANDWLKTPGVQADHPLTWMPFLEVGALPPRKIRPRNLNVPVYRGGGSPADLFLRMENGIEGTPMPSSPSLTDDEIWALVAFIKSLPYEHSAAGSMSVNQETGPDTDSLRGLRETAPDPGGSPGNPP